MSTTALERRVEAVRRFNRFYTRRIGVLPEGLVRSPFSLTEARVLYELAHRSEVTAALLGKELGLDAGYLSRILASFRRQGLLQRSRSATDARQSLLSLTAAGRAAFAPLDERSREDVSTMLDGLSAGEQHLLTEAMTIVERILGERAKTPYLIRHHQPGDMGWVVHRHAAAYAAEYGFDAEFEALVADIVASFIRKFDPKHERCWIAERDGAILGSVFLVRQSQTIGKLRLLLVEKEARGLGIGKRLVEECIRFARAAGYRKVRLWTNSVLYAARHLYEEAGFALIESEPHHSFGQDLVGEIWELTL